MKSMIALMLVGLVSGCALRAQEGGNGASTEGASALPPGLTPGDPNGPRSQWIPSDCRPVDSSACGAVRTYTMPANECGLVMGWAATTCTNPSIGPDWNPNKICYIVPAGKTATFYEVLSLAQYNPIQEQGAYPNLNGQKEVDSSLAQPCGAYDVPGTYGLFYFNLVNGQCPVSCN